LSADQEIRRKYPKICVSDTYAGLFPASSILVDISDRRDCEGDGITYGTKNRDNEILAEILITDIILIRLV